MQSAKSFGLLVRRYRAVAALTQEELASRAGLSVRAVSDMDHGRTRRPFLRPARAPATVADITRPSAATVGEYDHVAAAAYLMKHARSAALVVLGIRHGGRLVGVITEADIARALADGMDVNKTRIHDLLTARPAAIPAAASIRDAARTTVNGGFRQLPVAHGTGWFDIADVCGVIDPRRAPGRPDRPLARGSAVYCWICV